MIGTATNAAAIVAGGLLGVLLRRGIPEPVKETVMQGLGLSILLIGIQMFLKTENVLMVIISLVVGGAIGQLIDIERLLARLGTRLEAGLGGGEGKLSKAFVNASLVFCTGAMAIVGSIEDGLNGNPSILFAKAALDGVISIIFSSTMGVGVVLSALPILLYQGTITLLAGTFKNILTDGMLNELTATGGLLIVGIGINLLGLKEIKVGNLLPSLLVVALLVMAVQRFGGLF